MPGGGQHKQKRGVRIRARLTRSRVSCSPHALSFLCVIFRCRGIQERRNKALETLLCRMQDEICLLWPDTLIVPYGSYASGMMTADSDVDVVVSLFEVVPGVLHCLLYVPVPCFTPVSQLR